MWFSTPGSNLQYQIERAALEPDGLRLGGNSARVTSLEDKAEAVRVGERRSGVALTLTRGWAALWW